MIEVKYSIMKFSSLLNLVLLALLLLLGYFLYDAIEDKQEMQTKLENEMQGPELDPEIRNEISTWRAIDTLFLGSEFEKVANQYEALLDLGAIDSAAFRERSNHLRAFRERQNRLQQGAIRLNSELEEVREQLRISKDVNSILADDKAAFLDSLFSIKRKANVRIQEQKDSLRKQKKTIDSLSAQQKAMLQLKDLRGNDFVYLGPVKEGKAHGQGVGVWRDGGVYEGQWQDNRRHGQGRFEWTDGEVYEGAYENGKRSGEGTYIWTSGQKYVGEWKDDKRSGYGVLYNEYGNVSYKGQWQNDSPLRQ
jgi:hypothetical protein